MIGITLLLIASAFFAVSEIAFVACDRITLRSWAIKKVRGAKATIESLRKLDRLLITILVGNNLVNIGISVIAAKIWYKKIPDLLIILFVVGLIVIFGEILPKYIASRHKERVAIILTRPYNIIYWILYPLIFIGYQTSIRVLKLFKTPIPSTFHKFTREDIRIASEKALPLMEYTIISRLLDFEKKRVKEIMIPKNKMFTAPANVSLEKFKQIVYESGYSRIPVYCSNINEIVGVVGAKSLLTATRLEDVIKLCTFIDETKPVESLVEDLRDKESFFAIVKDKHGRTSGLITREDILEELFGEIEDEYDKI